jgi:hypothetical protein
MLSRSGTIRGQIIDMPTDEIEAGRVATPEERAWEREQKRRRSWLARLTPSGVTMNSSGGFARLSTCFFGH